MQKNETLKDGTKILIRDLRIDDLEKSVKFFNSLPAEDRRYLRVDVTKRDLVEKRIRAASTLNIVRIIAQFEEDIIADGALELSREGWREHQGEIRVIVARDYQREGLGMLMMRELYFLALERQVKKMIVKMMRPQVAARSICRKLGFHGEIIVPDYVLDRNGTLQDLIIMSCDIAEMWRDLEHFYSSSDWQRCR